MRDVEVSCEPVNDYTLNVFQYVATLASLYQKNYSFPKDKIDDSWEKLLLNQCA